MLLLVNLFSSCLNGLKPHTVFVVLSYFNGNGSGDLIEVCAGITDEGESVEEDAIREAKEELSYAIKNVKKVWEAYFRVLLLSGKKQGDIKFN